MNDKVKTDTPEQAEFRAYCIEWLSKNHPGPAPAGTPRQAGMARLSQEQFDFLQRWQKSAYDGGLVGCDYPKEYGGGGHTDCQRIANEEMQRAECPGFASYTALQMGTATLLTHGSEYLKKRFIPKMFSGEETWCQGFSEPSAGSDLASLQTFAEDKGDFFLVNGSKIWTSGASHADWMFALVRTDREVPKHEGISFLLLSMDSPGVSTQPIELLDGHSPFCQTFFDDVSVPKENLVHRLNQGWTVGKRLLQHERSGLAALASAGKEGPMERIKPSVPLNELVEKYSSPTVAADSALRLDLVENEQQKDAFLLTQKRMVEESAADTPGAATSIFKYVEANYVKAQLELQLRIRGTQGLGWEGATFDDEEISMCRLWLEAKSISIAGGSNEVQLNIIAKRVLGLPD